MFDFLKNTKWIKYYDEIKSYFNPRFLIDAIIPSDIIDTAKTVASNKSEDQIFRFIIGCAIVRGILIAIPGDVAVGLYIAQAIDFAMAANIARLVGLDFKKENIFKLLGAASLSAVAVLYAFEKVLNIIFKFVANLPIAAPASFVSTTITSLFLGFFLLPGFY